jgi:hypothetical protein
MADSDPPGDGDFHRPLLGRSAHYQRAARHVRAVVGAGDAHGQGEPPRPGRQVLRPAGARPALAHPLQPGHRLQRAQQHAPRRAVRLGHQVEAFVHAVDEIHVGVPGRPEDHARARREAAGGVRGQIAAAGVGFRLDDDAGGLAVYQHLAQQAARHGGAVALVEGAVQDRSEKHGGRPRHHIPSRG